MCLLGIRMYTETLFQIDKVDLGRFRHGASEGFIEETGLGATTYDDAIKALLAGTSGKLTDVAFWMTCDGKNRGNGRKNEPPGIEREGLPTVAQEQPPIGHIAPFYLRGSGESTSYCRSKS
jgi:hypothetical protein